MAKARMTAADIALPDLLSASACAMAVLQLILARWRDLGAITIGLSGMAVTASAFFPCDRPLVAVLLSASALALAVAWARGVRRGVGRLGVDGAVLSAMAVMRLAVDWVPSGQRQTLWPVVVGVGTFLTLFAGLLALERPGFKPQRPWVRRRVPVQP